MARAHRRDVLEEIAQAEQWEDFPNLRGDVRDGPHEARARVVEAVSLTSPREALTRRARDDVDVTKTRRETEDLPQERATVLDEGATAETVHKLKVNFKKDL